MLLIRADASVQIGTGHVMRMIALAQAWRRRGGEAHLLARSLPPSLAKRLETESIGVHHVAAAVAADDIDQQATINIANQIGARWVVADGYDFSPEFQAAIRDTSLRLAIVTDFDYCHRWSADVIINQNPHAMREPYACRVADCQRLFGTRFALLRQEFLASNIASAALQQPRRPRLLVTLGGSDADNVTGSILSLINQMASASIDIRVLVGPANPHLDRLREQAARPSHHVEVLTGVSDMPAQYVWADAAITAGGSSCWEWMYFGLPAAIIVIAENQQPIYDELVGQRIAVGLGTPRQIDRDALQRFAQSISSGGRDFDRFRDWVDGYGADRCAAAMDSGVWLRQATSADCRMYFDWANDPLVRTNSLQSAEISWSEHSEWFREQLGRDDRRLFVAMRSDRPVGQIRMSLTADSEWQIGFSVDAAARGGGIGTEILRLGIAAMQIDTDPRFVATVKLANAASAKCFERLGWQRTRHHETYQFRNA
ncbi:UDP-2,4-diacetamido-2,4,6-trideoxy-beta-L-altropyranose hydrolase [Allorhodopirellula heiligendammensis]|uniref:MurG-like transferase n=1 Tax=Allorhodopirellula heiligendammensis TaxID=2714739 RepID=A0A5C6BX52_9BACT|nr:UDP-2,4-diacetamido-2,4,6-trideoxy-beta-L-altropyranose hydrolase [Allorhodopirellula heiligendammensis]TWU15374.1 MurG-like transferase [Allorhodopirellula heiligendammensis]